jgi:citrate lyase gamma subunit
MKKRTEIGLIQNANGRFNYAHYYYNENGQLEKVVNARTKEVVWQASEADDYSQRSNL